MVRDAPRWSAAASLDADYPNAARIGMSEDYPGTIAFPLPDNAASITGQTLSVSGGLTME